MLKCGVSVLTWLTDAERLKCHESVFCVRGITEDGIRHGKSYRRKVFKYGNYLTFHV